MTKKFLYVNLGTSNSLVKYWLQLDGERNLYGKPAAVIFFGKVTTAECKELIHLSKEEINKKHIHSNHIPSYKNLQDQIKHFIEAADTRNTKFITLATNLNRIFIYEPISEVFDMPADKFDEYDSDLKRLGISSEKPIEDIAIPKIVFVNIIRTKKLGAIPYVLRTLQTNNYLTKGTCRQIDFEKNQGAIQAIKMLCDEEVTVPRSIDQLFNLLGPVQLETLVFLILINAGLFSPARRGGTLAKIDIIGQNHSGTKIDIGQNPVVTFEAGDSKTFQVKRTAVTKAVKGADWTIALKFIGKDKKKILTSEWLYDVIKRQTETINWLENSFRWFKKAVGIDYKQSIFQMIEN
ncbi:MAG: hypothetical protein ACTSQI_14245 [Candidatus Helarchaeota archaeon]